MRNKGVILGAIVMLCMLVFGRTNAKAHTNIVRISGTDRYKTSIEVSKNGWSSSAYVILASGKDFPDALCAAPLSKKYDAPILLTDGTSISEDISSELHRLNAKNIIIIGGPGAVSDDEEKSLEGAGYNCRRINGENRFKTSTKIAEEFGSPSEAVVVNGNNYPDGLSISPVAAMKDIPIILVNNDNINESAEEYLNNGKIQTTYVIGGEGAVSDSLLGDFKNPVRIYGKDRYDTNIKIFEKFFSEGSLNSSYMVSGEDFPDALASSALSAKNSKPLMLIDKSGTTSTYDYIYSNREDINNIIAIGGGAVIRPKVLNNLMDEPNSLIDNLNSVGTSTQVIIVQAASFGTFHATASAYEMIDNKWVQYVAPFPCVVGMNGFSTNRHEGDKTTPVGAYHFPFFFGWNGNPGFKFPFRPVGDYDYWVSNNTLDEYNVWMTYTGNPKNRFADYEHLKSQPLYKYAALIDFNYGPDKIYGKGSGIFMHIAPYSGGGTLGCVGMPEDELLKILMWMDPSKNPVIIMGPTSELSKM